MWRCSWLLVGCLLIAAPMPVRADEVPPFTPPADVSWRTVNIISDGVRLYGEVFTPKSGAGGPLPAVILCGGRGGLSWSMRWQATAMARAGYYALLFDYKGWGGSDGMLLLRSPAPVKKEGQRFLADVIEVREIQDPWDMVSDVHNVFHWLIGDPQVDAGKVALFGTSMGGGIALRAAIAEPRVKALVTQVGAFDLRGGSGDASARANLLPDATRRSRGELEYPPPKPREPGKLHGYAVQEKYRTFAPVDSAAALKVPALTVVAGKEELFQNDTHGKLVHDRFKGPKEYVIIPNITHYGVYREAREEVTKLEIAWLNRHLK